jgi:hypothetical protein
MSSYPLTNILSNTPLRAIGSIRFRPAGPSFPLYEATTDRGLRLCYWSPAAMRHIPVYDMAGVSMEKG